MGIPRQCGCLRTCPLVLQHCGGYGSADGRMRFSHRALMSISVLVDRHSQGISQRLSQCLSQRLSQRLNQHRSQRLNQHRNLLPYQVDSTIIATSAAAIVRHLPMILSGVTLTLLAWEVLGVNPTAPTVAIATVIGVMS